ncbi:MAG: single-stranded DNA-binding protein [Methylocystis sp.]
MTAHALITGAVFRSPERKISRGGKPYVSATIKCRDGEGSQFWRVTIFSESAGEEMMRLADGDSVSAQGALRAEIYRPDDGEPRLSLSLVADHVLALRQPKKSREKAADSRFDAASHHRSTEREQRASDSRRPAPSMARRERSLEEQAANGGGRFMRGAHAELDDDLPF